jgi:putative iron-dependent peroxidase
VQEQERIVGRTKLSDIELDDDVKPSYAHNVLTTIERDGEEVQILRDNMAFGAPGSAEYGTYFIGYARSPDTIEQMLRNMFTGSPEGNYDRLLDVSRAITGTLFFVPSAALLEILAQGPPAVAGRGPAATQAARPPADGSLGIGSLKGTGSDE